MNHGYCLLSSTIQYNFHSLHDRSRLWFRVATNKWRLLMFIAKGAHSSIQWTKRKIRLKMTTILHVANPNIHNIWTRSDIFFSLEIAILVEHTSLPWCVLQCSSRSPHNHKTGSYFRVSTPNGTAYHCARNSKLHQVKTQWNISTDTHIFTLSSHEAGR